MLTILRQFKVFLPPEHPNCLYKIATKDPVTYEIQVSLLNAKEHGRQQIKNLCSKGCQVPLNSSKIVLIRSEILGRDAQE